MTRGGHIATTGVRTILVFCDNYGLSFVAIFGYYDNQFFPKFGFKIASYTS